jgi:hypothetical protein
MNHGPCPMNQQAAQIAIAALANPQQAVLPARGSLARYQPQIGRQLPAIAETLPIAYLGCQGGCRQDADTGNCLHSLTRRVIAMPSLELRFEKLDPFHKLIVLLLECRQQMTRQHGQGIFSVLEQCR